ncbi:hypothetical protein [Halorarum salinum]|uniref:hypothetical protein n=1 Tax=Halorarum salinum TaxID=2743089 RepID=UPI002AA29BAF|nr:hypothetical protein [Halobaculum salinum]
MEPPLTDSPSTQTTRTYLELTPTEQPLDPATVQAQFKRLHQLTTSADQPWYRSLFTSEPRPTIEWLLATDGDPDTPLHYYVGIDDPDALDHLEQLVRTLVPNEYELDQTEWHPINLLPMPTPTPDEEDESDSEVNPTPTLQAVEFHGSADRREDWQTRLTPFEAFTESADTRLPLAAIVEALAGATCPTVYQTLLRPYRDWTGDAADRCYRLERGLDTPAQRAVDSIFPAPEADGVDDPETNTRLEELDAKNARRSFVVNARVVAVTEPGDSRPTDLEGITSAFEAASRTCYSIDATHDADEKAHSIYEDLTSRTVHLPDYDTLTSKLRGPRTRVVAS